jgi:hypothetical protein
VQSYFEILIDGIKKGAFMASYLNKNSKTLNRVAISEYICRDYFFF